MTRIPLLRILDMRVRGDGKLLIQASKSFERQAVTPASFKEVKKLVDEALDSLHNLVSLLQTQRRRSRRMVGMPGRIRDSIFKNLQPISVGA